MVLAGFLHRPTERLERFSIAFTANGRSDHVTMFSLRLLFPSDGK